MLWFVFWYFCNIDYCYEYCCSYSIAELPFCTSKHAVQCSRLHVAIDCAQWSKEGITRYRPTVLTKQKVPDMVQYCLCIPEQKHCQYNVGFNATRSRNENFDAQLPSRWTIKARLCKDCQQVCGILGCWRYRPAGQELLMTSNHFKLSVC